MQVFSIFFLKRYRAYFKGNFRKTIILGENKQARDVQKFEIPEAGFINTKTFPEQNKTS